MRRATGDADAGAVARASLAVLAVLWATVVAASGADAANSRSSACAGRAYSYAGLESATPAHGVAATLAPKVSPRVTDGHVAGWIGVGGSGAGGGAEWLQAGFASVTADRTSRMYYEVASGSRSRFHELRSDVGTGERHRFSVVEIASRPSWWRVLVDGKPVSPAIHLPGSHGTWYPQAVGENFNGAHGTCNAYAYEFSDLTVATRSGGAWRPFELGHRFEDSGYRVVRGATSTRFLARSA